MPLADCLLPIASALPQGIHAFIAYNGSMCPTSCKAPEGPVCQAACKYDDLAKMFNTFIEGEQVRDVWCCLERACGGIVGR